MKTGTSNRGFTLLELTLVVFLLSLFAGLVLPSLAVFEGSRTKTEARRIASVIRHLHESALTTKDAYPMHIDLSRRELRYRGPDGERAERVAHLRDMALLSRGKVSAGEVTVWFRPAASGEPFSLTLAGGEEPVTVSYHPLSGRVRVEAPRDAKRLHPA